MKAWSNIGIFGLSFVLITISVLAGSFHSDAFSQENKKKYDMVLLSQNYNSKAFADDIVGVILNNGTATARSVEISAIFFDDGGRTVGHESGGTALPLSAQETDLILLYKYLTKRLRVMLPVMTLPLNGKMNNHFYFTKSTGGEITDNSGGNDADGDDGDDDEDN